MRRRKAARDTIREQIGVGLLCSLVTGVLVLLIEYRFFHTPSTPGDAPPAAAELTRLQQALQEGQQANQSAHKVIDELRRDQLLARTAAEKTQTQHQLDLQQTAQATAQAQAEVLSLREQVGALRQDLAAARLAAEDKLATATSQYEQQLNQVRSELEQLRKKADPPRPQTVADAEEAKPVRRSLPLSIISDWEPATARPAAPSIPRQVPYRPLAQSSGYYSSRDRR
jgi:hypothetical protein